MKRSDINTITIASFLIVSVIMLITFFIPDEVYSYNLCIALLNLELLILFVKDYIIFFKRRCKGLQAISIPMIILYAINVIERFVDMQRIEYLSICILIIATALYLIWLIIFKRKENE